MELELAAQGARPNGRSHISNTTKDIPNYLKPSTGSCHHVCKYGGTHTSEEKDAHKAQPKPRKQPPASDQQKKSLIRVRLVPRKLFGDRSRGEKAGADKEKKAENVEWKDIVAYDSVSDHGSLPELGKQSTQVTGLDDVKNKGVMRGKKSHDKTEMNAKQKQVDGVKSQNESLDKKLINKSVRSKVTSNKVSIEPTHKNMNTDTKSVKPPRGRKPAVVVTKKKGVDQELVDGYQPLSPSLLQNRASLLRDLEEEMVHETTDMNGYEFKATYTVDQEEFAAAETSRPIPAHRRVKSMNMSSRSVRFPFARQASKNSTTFKLRSNSSKGPILPSEEKKPARLRSRRGSVGGGDEIGSTGRGIQFRIRSLRRRGVGGSGGASTGFVVPAVSLRHQKTLEKKKSRKLYNNMIEETASKLVKTRKSRVKALVGAFESVISKISK
ncbi:hypothetical protein PR202_ga12347 [Eleusine coracana subsp. coracana]|uniref:Calmodulin-binding domain-containing protein n=1 Tax=Eleusine coracana subsp. coracana TaxID=191504 RepID=A0AAV5CBY5_ELECO|nr:hypothetical protein PR202_ga12347 [Eleusine coracana subsp. coracana]